MVSVHREEIIDDMFKLYSNPATTRCDALDVQFVDEKAIDDGGVTREFYAAFWEEMYKKFFDGANLMVPAVHPGAQFNCFSSRGAIIMHGNLMTGALPVKIALPVLIKSLLSVSVDLPSDVLVHSFIDYLNPFEAAILRECLTYKGSNCYPDSLQQQILAISMDVVSFLFQKT